MSSWCLNGVCTGSSHGLSPGTGSLYLCFDPIYIPMSETPDLKEDEEPTDLRPDLVKVLKLIL